MRRLLRRDSGATYASIPMIGVTPAFFAEWKKSYAPCRLPWSDMAMWVMPISLHALNMSLSRAAPSSSEYWVWTCRCVNGGFDTVGPPRETLDDGLADSPGVSVEVYASGLTIRGLPRVPSLRGSRALPRTLDRWQKQKRRRTHPGTRRHPAMSVPQLNDEQRGEEILAVFDTAFGRLLAADPAAFRVKFRKMAASAFAFYRGTACLFYHDLEAEKRGGPYLDERTSRVWIHGDLHAENFGTYMDANGRLIFNVNDFDEAYVGPFTWDLKRFSASIALVGYAKALSDEQITELVKVYAAAYRERIHALATGAKSDEVPPFTLDTAEGPLLDALRDARSLTRFGLLDSMTEIRDFERRFAPGGGS